MKVESGFWCYLCKGSLFFGIVAGAPIFSSATNRNGTAIVACGSCHATFYVNAVFDFVSRTPPVSTIEEQRELENAHINAIIGEGR
jgi:hypothetical protein